MRNFKYIENYHLLFFDTMHSISDIIPASEEYLERASLYSDEQMKNCYYKALDDFNVAKNTLHKNAPFISEALYDQYSKMVELFPAQLDKYGRFYNFKVNGNTKFGEIVITAEDTEKTLEIHGDLMDISEKTREYLARLEVLS